MLDATRTALESVRLTNTELLLSEETKLPLEKSILDGALMAFVLQEANDRKGLLKDANRALCNGGWLAILEWRPRHPPVFLFRQDLMIRMPLADDRQSGPLGLQIHLCDIVAKAFSPCGPHRH